MKTNLTFYKGLLGIFFVIFLFSTVTYAQPVVTSSVESIIALPKSSKAPGLYGEDLYVTDNGMEIRKGQKVHLSTTAMSWGYKSIFFQDPFTKNNHSDTQVLAKFEDSKSAIEKFMVFKSEPGIAYARIIVGDRYFFIRIEMALREKEVIFE